MLNSRSNLANANPALPSYIDGYPSLTFPCRPLPPDMALCLAHDPLLIHMTAPPPGMALRQRLAKLGPRLLELLEVCLRPDPRDRWVLRLLAGGG